MLRKLLPLRRAALFLGLSCACSALLIGCGSDGGEPPVISSLGCAPGEAETEEAVSCAPSISGSPQTYSWSTSGGAPTNGSGDSFTTSYALTGSKSISLLACGDGGCSSGSQTIEVTAPAGPAEPLPKISSLKCTPTMAITDEPISCVPVVYGNVTSYVWSNHGGEPPHGTDSTFEMTYSLTGTKRIMLQACNGSGCTVKSQPVLVGPPPDPPDSDGDGIVDAYDHCMFVANPGQEDIDGDGIGDACDARDNRDSDGDGVQHWADLCPDEAENLNGYLDDDGCPDTPSVVVAIDGDSAVFAAGDVVTLCYSAGGQMFVDIDLVMPSGSRSDLFSAFDVDGAGGCFDWQSADDAESGTYAVEITGSGAVDSESFEIA